LLLSFNSITQWDVMYRNSLCVCLLWNYHLGEVNNTMLCMLYKNLNSCHFMPLKCYCNSTMFFKFMNVLRPFLLTCSPSPNLISDAVCIISFRRSKNTMSEHMKKNEVILCFRIKTLKVLSDGAELITPHVQSWPNKTPISYS